MRSLSVRSWRFYGLLLVTVAVMGSLLWIPIAEGKALNSEEAYISDKLEDASCLSYGSLHKTSGGYTRGASVTGLTLSGYRIEVTVPYKLGWEGEDGIIHADNAFSAVYEVSPYHTQRISGDTISFC